MPHTHPLAALRARLGLMFLLLTVIGVGGCRKHPEPSAPAPTPSATETPAAVQSEPPSVTPAPVQPKPPEPRPVKPDTPKREPPADFSLTAEAFYDDVVDDIPAAGKKYGKRVVELTGKVFQLARNGLDPTGPPCLSLGGPGRAILCSTTDRQPWLKCVHGQTVKVRGTVNGSLLFAAVGIQDCQFTVLSGEPALSFTVSQLLAALADDEVDARKKYNGKSASLSGEFISFKKGDTDLERTVQLKGDGKRVVVITAWSSDEPFLTRLKPGEAVTFLGKIHVVNGATAKGPKDRLELLDAVLTHASVLAP